MRNYPGASTFTIFHNIVLDRDIHSDPSLFFLLYTLLVNSNLLSGRFYEYPMWVDTKGHVLEGDIKKKKKNNHVRNDLLHTKCAYCLCRSYLTQLHTDTM